MRLRDLEKLDSFALLGPGYGGEPFLLLRDLSPVVVSSSRRADPTLVFAPFEAQGSCFAAASSVGRCEVEFEETADLDLRVSLAADGHAAKVAHIREAIARGDVYQVCLTVRAQLTPVSGAALLSRMCARGLPRFAAWVRLPGPGGVEFVSASPELFFETDGSHVHTEPMKGTARPGAGDALDSSDKDRAELAMITDLLRNDLAQVCEPKTVRVANERRLLELPYAVQTVSDVVGTLAPQVTTPLDVLAALHPGGSVTGAPKRAALDFIRELEPTPRGAYCGTLGLWSGDRSVFGLLIRTAMRSPPTGWVYGVGGGIVFDSDPRAEFDELETKLGILRCLTPSCA